MYVCLMNGNKARLCFSEGPMTWELRKVNTKHSDLTLSLAWGAPGWNPHLGVKNKPGLCEMDKTELHLVGFCMRRMSGDNPRALRVALLCPLHRSETQISLLWIFFMAALGRSFEVDKSLCCHN